MILRSIFDSNKCNKGKMHSYDIFYEQEFEKNRFDSLNILEIGIFKGASAKSWIEYFPNCHYFCIDIKIRAEIKKLLNHPRITYLELDSTKSLTNEKIFENVKFDIIIDDGLHTPEGNKKTFENFFPYLKDSGRYYIEDFFPIHLMTEDDFKTKSGQWVKQNNNWTSENIDIFLDFISKYDFETFDNRYLTSEQDSFIFKIKK